MKFDLSDKYQQLRFKEYSNKLYSAKSKVELKVIRKSRTYKQNRYLHVILSGYGLELGLTLDDVKQDIFKRKICKQDFVIIKNNAYFYKSTRDLDTKEMTIAIDRFRNHAVKDLGIYLPDPHEDELISAMEDFNNQYGNKQYL